MKRAGANIRDADELGQSIAFADFWSLHPAGSDVRSAEAQLFRFEKENKEAERKLAPESEQFRELVAKWDALREKIKKAKLKTLLDAAWRVVAVAAGKNDAPAEISKEILRTMVHFDPDEGTMSDAAGVRKFDCVAFFAEANALKSEGDRATNNNGARRPDGYCWGPIVDHYFTAASDVPPADLSTFYEMIRDAANLADPENPKVKDGGPPNSTIKSHFLKEYPNYYNKIKPR